MTESQPLPATTVIVVCDHVAGSHERWHDIRRILEALSRQETDEPFDILICESESFRESLPADLAGAAPRIQVRFFPDDSSFAIKNRGAAEVRTEFVAFLDADCVPRPGWLKSSLRDIRTDPAIGAVSGRTYYPARSFAIGVFALLDRCFVDTGRPGATHFLSINSTLFRRRAFMECPLPTTAGPFSAQIQSENMQRCGWTLFFDPEIAVDHDFDGWAMEADLRRNRGHGTIRTRMVDPSLRCAWLVRLGPAGIPVILAGKLIYSWRDCLRFGRYYGIRGLGIAGAMLLAIVVHGFEIPGMLRAFRGGGLTFSHFR